MSNTTNKPAAPMFVHRIGTYTDDRDRTSYFLVVKDIPAAKRGLRTTNQAEKTGTIWLSLDLEEAKAEWPIGSQVPDTLAVWGEETAISKVFEVEVL